MASTLVGVVRYWNASVSSGAKFMMMTIIPADDSELNNPIWTSFGYGLGGAGTWNVDMVTITQTQYYSYTTFAAFQAAILAM